MKTQKNKFMILTFLLFIYIFPIYSLSIMDKPLYDPFESEVELKKFDTVDNLSDEDVDFLNNSSISLLTKAPGKEIYSWFGHTEVLVETPSTSLVYDYGVFSFNTKNFYKKFIQGKMYYLLYVTYSDQSIGVSKFQDRSVSKITLDLTNEQKASIINFLYFNSDDSNRTYLYDFYKDNCATRVRDIFNWVTNDDFKTWAQNQESNGTFRQLSNRSLSKNLFIFWVLNAIQGQAADNKGTLWDDMYLPTHFENAILDYDKFGNSQTQLLEGSITFPVENTNNNHILLFSIISIFISLIAIILKRTKQIRNSRAYGIYNILILSFLSIISGAIFFLSFFSSINAAWYNENLIFLNPITTIFMLVLSIRLLSKKHDPLKRIIQFERGARWFSHIIFALFFIKLIPNINFFQNNLNIMIPIWIYFITQGTIVRSKK